MYELEHGTTETGEWFIKISKGLETYVKRTYERYISYYDDLIYYKQNYNV